MYLQLLGDVLGNVVLVAFLGTLVAKLNDAIIGPLYELAYHLLNVSEEKRQVWNQTRFLWAIAMGELLCLRAKIGFLPAILPAPDTYVVCGLLVGAGAGIVWDLVLDKPPMPAVPDGAAEQFIPY